MKTLDETLLEQATALETTASDQFRRMIRWIWIAAVLNVSWTLFWASGGLQAVPWPLAVSASVYCFAHGWIAAKSLMALRRCVQGRLQARYLRGQLNAGEY